MTICRDAFFTEWEKKYGDIHIWIDIKANGAIFDREQESVFARALPARYAATRVDYGVTVCLTGTFLDLFWQGRSSFLSRNNTGDPFVVAETVGFADFEYLRRCFQKVR